MMYPWTQFVGMIGLWKSCCLRSNPKVVKKTAVNEVLNTKFITSKTL